VAIVQVSRITQRKGLQTDLPQPLASAELGWSIDQRRLFIGNGTIAEGAPVVGNTEILTEFSDILGFFTQYTYEGDAAGYTAQTGSTPGNPVTQSLQRRLDSYAVVSSFGAVGDGSTDVTEDINRAMFQLYCRSTAPAARRSLFFPAGEYIITNTLNIPPNATLYGEGSDSTIINFRVLDWTPAVTWPAGVLVFNTDTGLYYRSNFAVPIDTAIGATTTGGDPFWTSESLPAYILATADSLQQTGVNIGTNGASAPGSVQVSGIKFVANRVTNGVLFDRAADCTFDNVSIQGALTEAQLTGTGDNTAAVRWNSTENQPCRNITWNNCDFSGFTFGTETDQNIRGITFSNNDFFTLYRGVVLGGVAPVNGGPTGVRIVQNTFDAVSQQGVIFNNVSLNATAYNTFYDVGNQFNGAANPNSAIIDINSDNNISVGDSFERNNTQSANNPRIALNNSSSIVLGMNVKDVAYFQNNVQTNTIANSIDLGTYKRLSGINDTLIDNTPSGNLAIVVNGVGRINAFKIDYTIDRLIGLDRVYRTGTLTVVSGTGFAYTDDFVENDNTGVVLAATYSAGPPATVTITYATDNSGSDTKINYSISTLG
jgi:hypothetical protein